MRSIQQATVSYEDWLSSKVVVGSGFRKRLHHAMSASREGFFRATFFRWAETFPQICAQLADSPLVLGVGDLHSGVFGIWRDKTDNLVWGIRDCNEACGLPYASDLVRLAVSLMFAYGETPVAAICRVIVGGYQNGVVAKGAPILPAHHPVLRRRAQARIATPESFWRELVKPSPWKDVLPAVGRQAVAHSLPSRKLKIRSLPIPRPESRGHVVLAESPDEMIAFEALELAPSAWLWAHGGRAEILLPRLLRTAIRRADPTERVRDGWVVRRLAPDSCHLPFDGLSDPEELATVFRAMGWEIANLHVGSKDRGPVLADLMLRRADWLERAAEAMAESVSADWVEWKKGSAKVAGHA